MCCSRRRRHFSSDCPTVTKCVDIVVTHEKYLSFIHMNARHVWYSLHLPVYCRRALDACFMDTDVLCTFYRFWATSCFTRFVSKLRQTGDGAYRKICKLQIESHLQLHDHSIIYTCNFSMHVDKKATNLCDQFFAGKHGALRAQTTPPQYARSAWTVCRSSLLSCSLPGR